MGAAAAPFGLLDALPARQQATDVAFGPIGRLPFQACYATSPTPRSTTRSTATGSASSRAAETFTDAIGWYPHRGSAGPRPRGPRCSYRDSTPRSSPVEEQRDLLDPDHRQERELLLELFGLGLGGGHVAGTGNLPTGSRRATTERPAPTRTSRSASPTSESTGAQAAQSSCSQAARAVTSRVRVRDGRRASGMSRTRAFGCRCARSPAPPSCTRCGAAEIRSARRCASPTAAGTC